MKSRPSIHVLSIFGVLFLMLAPAYALIAVGRGNAPVHDAGWPEGALAVANLKSRVGWWEGPPFGGGEWHFLYQGSAESFRAALTAFTAIRAPALELVLHDGPHEDGILKQRIDWSFTVWVPANWHRLFNHPTFLVSAEQRQFRQPVDPPRLDVYVGGGSVDWAGVKVPDHVRVRDDRAAAAGVAPPGGGFVKADVFDMATGKPVRGARLVVASLVDSQNPGAGYRIVAESEGDDAGRVEAGKIPAGIHRVSLEAAGFAPRRLDNVSFNERTFKKFTAELSRVATIRGTVKDNEGKPLKNVRVSPSTALAIDGRGYALPEPPEAVTDQDGAFALTSMPTGYTQFRLYEPGYYFSDLFTIHEVPGSNVVLHLTRAGGIQVTVMDKAGQPISRFKGNRLLVEVGPVSGDKVGSWGGSGMVPENGIMEFKNMPPGEYRLSSRPNPSTSNRRFAAEQIIQVKPGITHNVRLVYE